MTPVEFHWIFAGTVERLFSGFYDKMIIIIQSIVKIHRNFILFYFILGYICYLQHLNILQHNDNVFNPYDKFYHESVHLQPFWQM